MKRYHLVTFGCQMNQHDSDRIRDVLEEAGYAPAAGADTADLILLNTCSVREKAEQKLRSEVGRLGLLKRERPSLMLAVAGCVAQQEGERLVQRMPQIDVVIGPDQAAALPRLLAEVENGGLPQVQTRFDVEEPRFLPAALRPGQARVSDFVTIMKGCDERCTFCVVPTTRGPERYRSSEEVLEEVARRVAAGTREITLLGQTVDSYQDPLGKIASGGVRDELSNAGRPSNSRRDESAFPGLLRAIAERVPELARLRYTSPHPRHLTSSLVLAHRDLPVLARHVHMPVQSGSDRVLRRMLRRYSVAEYRERVGALRDAVPGMTLSTDVIVGFPGETRDDFERTLELVQELGFIGVYGFKYSPRPFTPALKLGDDVDEAEKTARLAELFELSEGLQREHLARLVGATEVVLVEGPGGRGGFTGRTARNEIVHFSASRDPTGELVEVTISRALKHSLQ
ncbi:MAG TPA: tRNA (N6-isopentenyl adenosine(37)-C2)-methylthiotransferase MiaB, partial [Polyangiaceae bacterium]|nr:tRNA (N6-isopentenyl adenosine(37)-C2)-methylthiotransferase MiaB [Polyangiaceae bacterium]